MFIFKTISNIYICTSSPKPLLSARFFEQFYLYFRLNVNINDEFCCYMLTICFSSSSSSFLKTSNKCLNISKIFSMKFMSVWAYTGAENNTSEARNVYKIFSLVLTSIRLCACYDVWWFSSNVFIFVDNFS